MRVVAEKFRGVNSEIYGEIKAMDFGETIFDIYKVEKETAKPIPKDGVLPLKGPSRCILSHDFLINASLKNRHADLEVSDGHISLPRESKGVLAARNMPFHIVIPGDHGYSMFHLSIFEGAVQATVEVRLVTIGDNIQQPPRTIYGEIFTEYSKYEYDTVYARKYYRTRLFNVPQDEPIEVAREDKGKIPLSRCAVAVPPDSSVLIHVNLGIGSPETSSQVVNMSHIASFTADSDTDGISTEYIDGKFGRIKVKLTWLKDVHGKAIKELMDLIDKRAD